MNRSREWIKCVCCNGTGSSSGMDCFYCDGKGGFETEPEEEPETKPKEDDEEERIAILDNFTMGNHRGTVLGRAADPGSREVSMKKAKVLAKGQFYGQVAEIIGRDKKGGYRLATSWDGMPYPAWFAPDEVEEVDDEPEKKSESEP